MRVSLLKLFGIWFIKATTEESFSLTRTKPHPLQEGIQHTPNYIQDIFSLAACLYCHVISLIPCFQMFPCLNFDELLALFVLA